MHGHWRGWSLRASSASCTHASVAGHAKDEIMKGLLVSNMCQFVGNGKSSGAQTRKL